MSADNLTAVCIAERDHNGDSMLVWSYPGTDTSVDAHVLKRCRLEMEKVHAPARERDWCVLQRFDVHHTDEYCSDLTRYPP